MFDAMDSEKKGVIDIDDLVEIFREQNLPDVYIKMIMDYVDNDKNHMIDFEEFRDFIMKDDLDWDL